jgi:3-methyl-2-oxobutanoate hydroxymethyltransferase
VERLVLLGIPVIGHIGLTPQSIHQLGGFKRQGTTDFTRKKLIEDALSLQQAGAAAVVLECIPHDLASEATATLTIPTIGIGSGPHCDGQVLVSYDLLGLTENPPPFVKRYAQLGDSVIDAAKAFACDVKTSNSVKTSAPKTPLS